MTYTPPFGDLPAQTKHFRSPPAQAFPYQTCQTTHAVTSFTMTSTATVQLSEDTIDDILYCARAGLTSDLQEAISELCTSGTHTPAAVLSAAVDSNTGNTALHMAAANGHDGM